jgi:hypothetical protein
MNKLYIPSPYALSIRYRKPHRNSPLSIKDFSLEVGFDTWDEAHSLILARCERELGSAKISVSRAEKTLSRAKAMKRPLNEA